MLGPCKGVGLDQVLREAAGADLHVHKVDDVGMLRAPLVHAVLGALAASLAYDKTGRPLADAPRLVVWFESDTCLHGLRHSRRGNVQGSPSPRSCQSNQARRARVKIAKKKS